MRASLPVIRAGLMVGLVLSGAGSLDQDSKPSPAPLEYLGEWGVRGDGPGQLKEPAGLAVDFAGSIYIADRGSGFVHKFDGLGKPLLSFQDDLLERPGGIAVDRGGAIYVADVPGYKVVIFYPDGTRLRVIRRGKRRLQVSPEALAVDDDGNLYVVGAGTHCVQKFDPRGRSRKVWGRRGDRPSEFSVPSAVAVGPDGVVYIADRGNGRIYKFGRDSEFLSAWGGGIAPPDQMGGWSGVAVSKEHVWSADAVRVRVHAWLLDGQPRWTEDLAERLTPGPRTLMGLAYSPRRELLVLDTAAARVLRFRINF